jgi:1-acyl-sn-glycerol-3-phosphate acyltransferase
MSQRDQKQRPTASTGGAGRAGKQAQASSSGRTKSPTASGATKAPSAAKAAKAPSTTKAPASSGTTKAPTASGTTASGATPSGTTQPPASATKAAKASAGAVEATTTASATKTPSAASATKAPSASGAASPRAPTARAARPAARATESPRVGASSAKPARPAARATHAPVALPVADARAPSAPPPSAPPLPSLPGEKRLRPGARRPTPSTRVEPPQGAQDEPAIDAEVVESHDTRASPPALEAGWAIDVTLPTPAIEVAQLAEPSLGPAEPIVPEDDEPAAATEFDYAAAPSRFTDDVRADHVPDDVGLPEARIDTLLDEATRAADDPASRMRMAEAFSEIAQQLGGIDALPADEEPGLFASAKELLSPAYYVRQWGRVAMRNRSEDVDDFGLDPTYQERARPWLDALHRRWFRTKVHGLEHVPAAGRGLLVANHAGALPWDGLMLQTAIRLEHPTHREVRWLTEDVIAHSPFLGAITNRLGAVRACPENAERLLVRGKLVAVFPEGEKGLGKPWAKRYEIQRFGRGGFVKLALRTRTPIVPVGIVGSEETHPLLFRTDRWARLLGVPFLPVTPTFPWLGPLGLVPLPSRWVIRFGAPIDLSDEPAGSEHDPVRVQHLGEEVRSAVQALVKRGLEERPRAF